MSNLSVTLKPSWANQWTYTLKRLICIPAMSRRLLALLALLSGLAALHAPAHASRLDDLTYDIETLAEMVNAQANAGCQCEHPPQKRKVVCDERSKPIARPGVSGVLRPSVVVGADKSLE